MNEVLIVSIGFSPNIGGIETHFDDLVAALDKRGWRVWVLTYKPITTSVKALFFEKRGKKIFIYRIPWFGGIFYKLVKNPILEFIFLSPGLFLALPIFLIFKGKKIHTIHSHGLVAGFVSVVWGRVFGRRVITTTHSIYNFPEKGLFRNFSKWIFNSSDTVLTLSKQSKKEIEDLGIEKAKVKKFTYWVDLKKFIKIPNARKILGWDDKFVVLFVGRLVKEKGVLELLEAVQKWNKNITLVVAGTGPLEQKIKNLKIKNLRYLGKVDNDKLPLYYSAVDLLIVPSIHEEGFGRVILESLACDTPVIGANRGAIPEALDSSVGELIAVTPTNILNSVNTFYKDKEKLRKKRSASRLYAASRYSEKNADIIIKNYHISYNG